MENNPYAEEILDRLKSHQHSKNIVLGGYFALHQYLPYRRTYDVDAWWLDQADTETKTTIAEVMREFATEEGLIYKFRNFNGVDSFELHGENKHFSFQIAHRSTQIEPAITSAWDPIQIETLKDNMASKMVALVGRGAPRDFTDIKHIIDSAAATPDTLWKLWQLKNPDANIHSARNSVYKNLLLIEKRRPLESIPDVTSRKQAQDLRLYFKKDFCQHTRNEGHRL